MEYHGYPPRESASAYVEVPDRDVGGPDRCSNTGDPGLDRNGAATHGHYPMEARLLASQLVVVAEQVERGGNA